MEVHGARRTARTTTSVCFCKNGEYKAVKLILALITRSVYYDISNGDASGNLLSV